MYGLFRQPSIVSPFADSEGGKRSLVCLHMRKHMLHCFSELRCLGWQQPLTSSCCVCNSCPDRKADTAGVPVYGRPWLAHVNG